MNTVFTFFGENWRTLYSQYFVFSSATMAWIQERFSNFFSCGQSWVSFKNSRTIHFIKRFNFSKHLIKHRVGFSKKKRSSVAAFSYWISKIFYKEYTFWLCTFKVFPWSYRRKNSSGKKIDRIYQCECYMASKQASKQAERERNPVGHKNWRYGAMYQVMWCWGRSDQIAT